MKRIGSIADGNDIVTELVQPALNELGRLFVILRYENPHMRGFPFQSWSTLPSDLFSTTLPVRPSMPISWTWPRC